MTATDWEPVAVDGPTWEGPCGWPADEWFTDHEWGDEPPDLGDDR